MEQYSTIYPAVHYISTFVNLSSSERIRCLQLANYGNNDLLKRIENKEELLSRYHPCSVKERNRQVVLSYRRHCARSRCRPTAPYNRHYDACLDAHHGFRCRRRIPHYRRVSAGLRRGHQPNCARSSFYDRFTPARDSLGPVRSKA